MALRLSEIIGSFHAAVYSYCHSTIGDVAALIMLIGIVVLSWRLFISRSFTGRINTPAGILLAVLHVLVAIDWAYRKLHWGEHPFPVLCSLAFIDAALFVRTRRPLLVSRDTLCAVFFVAAVVFTFTFFLSDLFPVFVTIDW